MITLSDYLDPVSIDKPEDRNISEQSRFSRNIMVHTENKSVDLLKDFKVAIIGVPDGRKSPGPGSDSAPDAVRKALYEMARTPGKLKIADLGNIKKGHSYNDTIAGLADVLGHLYSQQVLTIVIGGSGSLIEAIDRVYRNSESSYVLANIDARIRYNPESIEPGPYNTLFQLFQSHNDGLSQYINIGYQTYLNDPQVITRLTRKQHELLRLGDVRQAIHLTEPLIRDCDALLFVMEAIRQADSPGTYSPSPNGIYAEEACLLARYAGVSEKLSFIAITDAVPDLDKAGQTTNLAAQIIWFIIESFAQKQSENPADSTSGNGRFTRYHMNIDDLSTEMIFVKSNYTERWWMEVSSPGSRPFYISCSYEDYQKANNNEVPELWIKASSRSGKS
jgi:arginase family enzyme